MELKMTPIDEYRYLADTDKRMIINPETGDIGIGIKLPHDLEIGLDEVKESLSRSTEITKPLFINS
ncbi:hypothetical protein KAR91_64285 [Candidatus Pacearchaeota archaeon]|nr:hypothetical protein [Candidatus Pacearchaeota archaeon]